MLVEHLAHGELTRGRQLDQLPVPFEEQLAGVGAQILAQQEVLDLELLFGVAERLSQRFHRDTMIGAQGAKHVRFDEVPERENWRLPLRKLQQGLKVPGAGRSGIRPSRDPGAQRGRRKLQIPRRFQKRVGGLSANVVGRVPSTPLSRHRLNPKGTCTILQAWPDTNDC